MEKSYEAISTGPSKRKGAKYGEGSSVRAVHRLPLAAEWREIQTGPIQGGLSDPETQLIQSNQRSRSRWTTLYSLSPFLSRDRGQIPVVFVHPASHSLPPPLHYYCSEWVRKRRGNINRKWCPSKVEERIIIPLTAVVIYG